MYKSYDEDEKKKKQEDSTPQTTQPTQPKYEQYKPTQYAQSQTVTQAQNKLNNHMANKPAQYQSQWGTQLDNLMNQILNREKFSYDMNADAMYQQYKDMYTNQANMGMQNAMAQASAMTGGYGSSYGQMVGQQAFNNEMQNLNAIVPDLYQNALNQYINEGNNLYNQYGMVADRENLDYGRYRDSVSDYWNEASYLNSMYNTEADRDYSRYADDRNFSYGQFIDDRNLQYQTDRDAISDSRYEQEWAASEDQRGKDNQYRDEMFDYQQGRDEIADSRYEQEWAASEEQRESDNQYRDEVFDYQKDQDAQAQTNWQNQFDYQKEQDAQNQANWQNQFDYQKTQDAQSQANWQSQFDYQKEQDAQNQANWETQWQASEEQRELENQWYEDALNPTTTAVYEGDGMFNGEEVPIQLANVPGLTTTDTRFFDENGRFKTATVAYTNAEDKYVVWNIDGKEVKLQVGMNPYTNTRNDDIEFGLMPNSPYQPNNVASYYGGDIEAGKLTETGRTDAINGVKVPIYQTSDGTKFIWDDTANAYLEYVEDEETPQTPSGEAPAQTGGEKPTSDGSSGATTDKPSIMNPKDDGMPTAEDWANYVTTGTPVSNPIQDETMTEQTADIIDADGMINNPPVATDAIVADLINDGWTENTTVISNAAAKSLIEKGRLIIVNVNGKTRYFVR